MSEKKIELAAGDTLIVSVKSREPPSPPTPVEPEESLEVLITIGGVPIYTNKEDTYIHFLSDLDVCTDGSGASHSDQYHQSQTAYYSGGCDGGKYMNADKDLYVVVPPQIRSMIAPVVMGCAARVTNMKTNAVFDAVVGDIGPESKTGECGYRLARMLNPSVTANSGDSNRVFLYELWPGKAATVEGFTYKLQGA